MSYVPFGCVCVDADYNSEMLPIAASVSAAERDQYCRQCCQTAACQRSCWVVRTNRSRSAAAKLQRALRRINASRCCFSDEFVKSYQVLDAYCSLGTTTDLYATCSASSSMTFRAYTVCAHEMITVCSLSVVTHFVPWLNEVTLTFELLFSKYYRHLYTWT